MSITKDQLSEAGFQAREDAQKRTREAFEHEKIDEFYAAKHLKRLSRFKVQKAQYEKTGVVFDKKTGKPISVTQGYWTYSKKLDDGGVQLKAVDIMAHLLDMYPSEKHELTGKNGGPLFALYEAVKGKAGSLVNDPNKRG